jgi:hypothetical protein
MMLLPSLSSAKLEIVISTEAAHRLIVSRAAEKSAVAVASRFCFFFASHPQQKNPVLLKSTASEPALSGAEWVPQVLRSNGTFSP